MEQSQIKKVPPKTGDKLKELSEARRKNTKANKALIEILEDKSKSDKPKKIASSNSNKDLGV
jgi:hypothetical protein